MGAVFEVDRYHMQWNGKVKTPISWKVSILDHTRQQSDAFKFLSRLAQQRSTKYVQRYSDSAVGRVNSLASFPRRPLGCRWLVPLPGYADALEFHCSS